jgi:hypothetical protein
MFVIKAMYKKELRDAYGMSKAQWQAAIDLLPKELGNQVHKTRTILLPKLIRALIAHWGEPD